MVWSHRGDTHRPLVMGVNGMVACAHPLAALAGLEVLRDGGHAVDAAIAVSAALDVVEPFMSGLGGGGAMIVRESGGPTVALHYGGRFPAAASVDTLDAKSVDTGPKAPAVPGAPAGWFAAHARFGRLDVKRLFAPAIRYAEEGFGLTPTGHGFFRMGPSRLNDAGRDVLLANGAAPLTGTRLRQPALAQTYRQLARDGVDAFYTGSIGERIVRAVADAGGLMTADDLARPQYEWSKPTIAGYRGLSVISSGWPFTSWEVLLALNILGCTDAGGGVDDARTWHLRIEAAKLAMTERVARGGEVAELAPGLLSEAFAAERFGLIDGAKALLGSGDRFARSQPAGVVVPGSPADYMRECTTHFDVADADGNVVGVTQTLGSVFGSGFMAGDTGVVLNNLMFFFDLDAGSPMSVNLGAMRSGPLSPMLLLEGDDPFLLIGTPGAFGIPQTTMQMITNVVDHGMSVQAAIEAPRFRLYGGRRVGVEGRVAGTVMDTLKRNGHELQTLGNWSPAVGGGQGILIDADSGVLSGGADPRRDGYAMGW